MQRVETTGVYHYEITGEREKEAAEELTKRLDAISRDYFRPSGYKLDDIADARTSVAGKYGVEIHAVEG